MKKIIFISALSFLLFSCESNDETTTNQQNELSNRVANGDITTYHDNGRFWGCFGAPLDCLPEIVVTPSKISFARTIIPLMDAVRDQNSGLVKQIFINNQSDLSEYFEQNIINSFINGDVTLRVRSKVDLKEYYFIFEDSGKNIKRVYPIFE
jgi:hypothetical protein